jgi:hypothetical protein
MLGDPPQWTELGDLEKLKTLEHIYPNVWIFPSYNTYFYKYGSYHTPDTGGQAINNDKKNASGVF